jgi:diguanylate cyclase (GGDEF)-like protein
MDVLSAPSHDPWTDVRTLGERGRELLGEGRHQEAREALEQGLDMTEVLPDGDERERLSLELERELIKCCVYLRDFKAALEHGHRALRRCQDAGKTDMEARVHNELGVVYGRLGLYTQALEHMLESLRYARVAAEAELWAPLNNVGQLYMEQGKPLEARRSFAEALAYAKRKAESRAVGIIEGNLGRASLALGELEPAQTHFECAVRHFEELDDPTYLAPALTRLGSLLAERGETERALEHFERSLALQEKSEAFIEETLLALGRLQLQRGVLDEAEAPLTRARMLAEEASMLGEAAEANRLLAELHQRRGAYPEALAHFRRHHEQERSLAAQVASERLQGLMVKHEVEALQRERELAEKQQMVLGEANRELQQLNAKLAGQAEQLERLSREDGLTGLYNRRHLDECLQREAARARRYRQPLSLVMCDIDHFKQINDTFSHALGDEVLRRVAEVFRRHTRENDVPVRYGGEEFVVLLPKTPLSSALVVGEKMRRAVGNYAWEALAPGLRVTLSVGVASCDEKSEPHELLAAADTALYRAKHEGRDTVRYLLAKRYASSS